MTGRHLLLALVCGSLGGTFAQARIATYVESASLPADPDEIAIGYPVPEPRDQAAPFAGFRSLNGLYLRAAELAEQSTGPRLSIATASAGGRDIPLLCFGPADSPVQVLQTGGIHAREWAAPEAVMGLAEAFTFERDQPLIGWVAANIPACLAPVINPDGFAQTQREALLTRVCEAPEQGNAEADCDADSAYPRDGRMRRKNLRDSDGDISTTADALNGVDLNRNNAPYWATSSSGSSNDPQRILYHGPATASEAETGWLNDFAAALQPDQIRLYVDTHSFGRLYYWNCTGNRALDTTANNWIERFRLAARTAYANVPTGNPVTGSGCGQFGIGATDELFAFNATAPSYTLELEPGFSSGASEYGGTGVSHDGFILPEAIVPTMRSEVVQMMTLAYAMTAGPAWVRVVDVQSSNATIYTGRWSSGSPQRSLSTQRNSGLAPGSSVRIGIEFDRPMRWLEGGTVTTYPGQEQPLNPTLQWRSGAETWSLETSSGTWTTPENGLRTQRFEVSVTVPQDWKAEQDLQLQISAADNATFPIDANPASVPTWSNGNFSGTEDGADGCHWIVRTSTDDADCGGGSRRGSGGGSGLLVLLGLAVWRRQWARGRAPAR